MKKLISILTLAVMFSGIMNVHAQDEVYNVGATVKTDSTAWETELKNTSVSDGVLTITKDVASYKTEKYGDGSVVFSAKVDDDVVWEGDAGAIVNPWIGFAVKHKTADCTVWGGQNEAAYLIVVKPHCIELQRWRSSTTEMLLVIDNTVVTDKEWHNYEFSTVSTNDAARVSLAVDGVEVIDYVDKELRKVTAPGYFTAYNWLNNGEEGYDLLIKEFKGDLADFGEWPAEETDTSEEEEVEEEVKPAPKPNEVKIYPADDVTIIVDGEKLVTDVAPVIINDRILVPFRAIFEKLGAEVEWVEETRTVKAKKSTSTLQLTIDSNYVVVNGAEQTTAIAPIIVNDRTMVPIRFVSETFKANVEWDDATRTATITNK